MQSSRTAGEQKRLICSGPGDRNPKSLRLFAYSSLVQSDYASIIESSTGIVTPSRLLRALKDVEKVDATG